MAVDLYAPCPCGSGKKIKFCCSHDLVAELDKISRSLEGEQRIAALDQINRVMAAKGARPALYCLKTSVLLALNDIDQAQKNVTEFLELAPQNTTALAQASLVAALQGNMAGAVDCAQRSLESSVEVLPIEIYRALDRLAAYFAETGNVIAAKAHFMLLVGLSEENRDRPISAIMQINQSRQIPLLLKQQFVLSEAPVGVAWEEEFDAALDLADRQAWQAACERLVTLAGKVPPHSAILRNIAILRSYLGDIPVATAAWHTYAELEDVAQDDAIEAEALAQLLDPDSYLERVDHVRVIYTVNNTEKLMERLLSDKRASRMPVDPAELAEEDQPPPKALFWLLDRNAPTTGVGIKIDEVPSVLGEIAVFGKQTDREARLEFMLTRTADFEQRNAALRDLIGEFITGEPTEEILERVSAVGEAITWRWRFPDDTPTDLRDELIAAKRRETLYEVWPNLPLSVLDGKSAKEAAADPEYHIRALAAILLLELSGHQNHWDLDFNELRTKLGLPRREMIEAAGDEINRLSILRLSLLQPEKLADADLSRATIRAAMHAEHLAAKNLAEELIRRPSTNNTREVIAAYEIMASSVTNVDKALEYLHLAREKSESLKVSAATLMLRELQLLLANNRTESVMPLIEVLQRRHIREPGIAQQLYQILSSFGLISPEGAPRMPAGPEAALVGAGAPAAGAGGIWTPGSDAPAPPAGESKSKLWLPGMD